MSDVLEDNEVIAQGSLFEADRQVIHRIKAKNRPEYPKAPEKLSVINLPEFLLNIINKKKEAQYFLLHDSGFQSFNYKKFIIKI